jgi:hypothetical protein
MTGMIPGMICILNNLSVSCRTSKPSFESDIQCQLYRFDIVFTDKEKFCAHYSAQLSKSFRGETIFTKPMFLDCVLKCEGVYMIVTRGLLRSSHHTVPLGNICVDIFRCNQAKHGRFAIPLSSDNIDNIEHILNTLWLEGCDCSYELPTLKVVACYDTCPICLEDVSNTDYEVVQPCKYCKNLFHASCWKSQVELSSAASESASLADLLRAAQGKPPPVKCTLCNDNWCDDPLDYGVYKPPSI